MKPVYDATLVAKLNELTETMEIPIRRRGDVKWLALTKMGFRNNNHPNYEKAYALTREIIMTSK